MTGATLGSLARRTLLALAFAGCTAAQAYRQELDRYQPLADQATDQFNKIRVSLALTAGGVSKYRPPNSIVLNTQGGFERSLPILAHELGHHILGHGEGKGGSAHEMGANAMAVEVVQVWGYSEREAVVMIGGMLCRRQARGASGNIAGHLSAADELEDLKRRFSMPMLHCLSPR